MISPAQLKKYARTQDIQIDTGRPRKRLHEYAKPEKKRILELQPGPSCSNSCHGCKDIRTPSEKSDFLSRQPESIDRIFDILEIAASPEKWRIQVSGAITDPLTMSRATWARILDNSEGHDIIIHTGSHDSNKFSEFFEYLAPTYLERKGNFVLIRSQNMPIPLAAQNQASAEYQFQKHLGLWYSVKYEESSMWSSIERLRGKINNSTTNSEKFSIIVKQVIYLEDNAHFYIDQDSSIEMQRQSIERWSGIADTYAITPAFFKYIGNRVPLQEKFEKWLHKVVESFKGDFPNLDIMYRLYGALPQRTDKSGVSDYQYTVSRAGFFTPCDYSEKPIPGLPRIDDASLTKELIDKAYSGLSYKTEPCKSCAHRNCTHDFYE